jgi:hypothetical protein
VISKANSTACGLILRTTGCSRKGKYTFVSSDFFFGRIGITTLFGTRDFPMNLCGSALGIST